jgi:hypothetical protein
MSSSSRLLPKLPNSPPVSARASDVAKLTGGEKLLLLTVITSVGLDVLTNAFDPSPLVAPLKGLILLIVVFSFRTLSSYCVTFAFLGIFALRELNIALSHYDVSIMGDLTFFLRILFFITWLLLFYERRQSTEFLRYVMRVSVATIVLSVLCQFAGMALHLRIFQAYAGQGRGGYKGLFLSENDTSVFYLVTLIYAMFRIRMGNWLIFLVILAGLVLLGLGSKTALLGALLVPIVYLCCICQFRSPIDFRRLTIRPRLAIWSAASVLIIAITSYSCFIYLSQILSFIKYDQLIRVYQESGLLSSLLSFRDQKALAYFQSIRSVFDVLFGLQLRVKPQGFAYDETGYFMYEIDLFDYLARVGLVGSALTLGLIWHSTALRHWRSRPPELRALIITLILLGCTVGHTLISSMNGLWIGFWLIAIGNLPMETPAVLSINRMQRLSIQHGRELAAINSRTE